MLLALLLPFACAASSPPISDLNVFRDAAEPGHVFVVARGEGSTRVLEYAEGKLNEVPLGTLPPSSARSGLTLPFADGRWLMASVPSEQASALDEDFGAGIVDPLAGRAPLIEVEVSAPLIEELGLGPQMAPSAWRTLDRDGSPPFDAHDNYLIFFDLRVTSPGFDVIDELTKHFFDRGERLVHVAREPAGERADRLTVWALHLQAPEVRRWLRERLGVEASGQRQTLQGEGAAPEAARFLDEAERRAQLGDDLILPTFTHVSRLERLRAEHLAVRRELRRWDGAELAIDVLKTGFIQRLGALTERAYRLLDRIGTPNARAAIALSGGAIGPRLGLMDRRLDTGTYFDLWFDSLRTRLTWASEATPERLSRARTRPTDRGIVEKFGFLDVHLNDFLPDGADDGAFAMFPLRVLGLTDQPTRRQALVRLILEADKAAEHARAPDDAGAPLIAGSRTLAELLTALALGVADHDADPGFPSPNFNRGLYLTQAAQILTEVLKTSPVTITNSAAFVSLLNAALLLQDQIKTNFEIERAPSVALTRALIDLMGAVQTRGLRLAFLNSAGCEAPLLPR